MERSREKIKRSKTCRKDASSTSSHKDTDMSSRLHCIGKGHTNKYKGQLNDDSVQVTEPLLENDEKIGFCDKVWHQMKSNRISSCCTFALRGNHLTIRHHYCL